MRLIVGLGNPGPKYERNRHNIGFLAIDAIARGHVELSPWRERFHAHVSEGRLGGEKTLLMKPTTFMNDSGRAVGDALRFYKISPEDVVVIYDEMDLPPGKFRVKASGGHGGHNGLRSISAHIGADYRRLRLGVGHPGRKELVTNWVLGDFAKADQKWLTPLLDEISRHAALLARGQDSQFANKLTLALRATDVGNGKPADAEKPLKGATAPKTAKNADKPNNTPDATNSQDSAKGPLAAGLSKLFGSKG